MRWGSFIFGVIFIIIGLLTGFGIIIFGPIGLVLVVYGVGESEPEKVQKQHLEETKNLREEIQTLKESDIIKEQTKQIEELKQEINYLKGKSEKPKSATKNK